tara:strand:+ start:13150 stop:13584 length:435 start_codon:yes stop_codon:yes gene_type:complete
MQTVYLLKDCYKSYNALKKLYSYPDLSTNIIIVNREQARILLLDKRVKKFPFIINTLPTNLGLIPKIAKVLPLEMFMVLKKLNDYNKRKQEKILNVSSQNVLMKNRQRVQRPINNFYKPRPTKNKHLIRTVKDSDGSVNIILNK